MFGFQSVQLFPLCSWFSKGFGINWVFCQPQYFYPNVNKLYDWGSCVELLQILDLECGRASRGLSSLPSIKDKHRILHFCQIQGKKHEFLENFNLFSWNKTGDIIVLQKHDWFFWCQRVLRWKAETELSQLSTFSKLNLLLQFRVISGRAGEKQKGVSPLSSTPAFPHHCNMARRIPQRPLCWGIGFQPVEQLGSIGTFKGWSFMGES